MAHRFINLLYPPACLLCQTPLPADADSHGEPALLCQACRGLMPRVGPPVCARCGLGLPGAFDADVTCASCRKRMPAFEMARAPWSYAGAAQDAVQQFKYRRRWRLGRWLASAMTDQARTVFPLDKVDAVVPVPSHWLKRRLQGFSAAEALALAVARSLQLPYAPQALRRRRWTATQTRLGWQERARNVQGAFTAAECRHRSVLLVDDVLTSGATAGACAAALKAGGAARVFVLTAARTPAEPSRA